MRRPFVFALAALAACGELRGATMNDDAGAPRAGDDDDASVIVDAGGPHDATDAPVAPPDVPCDGPCTPELLVDGLPQATAVTVDANNVYYAVEATINGEVYQCPKTGCNGAPILLGKGFTRGIAVGNGRVFWTDFAAKTIESCAIGGCGGESTTLATHAANTQGVATDGTNIVWNAGGIYYCPMGSCDIRRSITAGLLDVAGLAAGKGRVLWTQGGKVRQCPLEGNCLPTALGTGTHDIAIAGDDAFWCDRNTNSVVACALDGCNDAPRKMGSSPLPFNTASDGTHVYWRDAVDFDIYRCPVAGCSGPPEVFADAQRGQPGGKIAFDDRYVYWTNTRAVYRKRK